MGIQNWSDDVILVNLAKEPDMGEELQTVIGMVTDNPGPGVVVSFADVDIITSSSIAKLLKLRKVLCDHGQKLMLCGLQAKTRSVFSVTGLDNVFQFVDDQFVALASLQLVN